MLTAIALALVADVTCLCSRPTPGRVNTDSCGTNSLPVPSNITDIWAVYTARLEGSAKVHMAVKF